MNREMRENQMTPSERETVLVVSNNPDFCSTARRELESRHNGLRVTAISTPDAACQIVRDARPTVILLDDASVLAPTAAPSSEVVSPLSPLQSVVSELSAFAAIVVVGNPAQQRELCALMAAGVADFVARDQGGIATAIELVEHRLREARSLSKAMPVSPIPVQAAGSRPHPQAPAVLVA